MERISKPQIVDLLRVFDLRRLVQPRIRYASVRSKPELIKGRSHFRPPPSAEHSFGAQ